MVVKIERPHNMGRIVKLCIFHQKKKKSVRKIHQIIITCLRIINKLPQKKKKKNHKYK